MGRIVRALMLFNGLRDWCRKAHAATLLTATSLMSIVLLFKLFPVITLAIITIITLINDDIINH